MATPTGDAPAEASREFKVVVVGDGGVGKTCMLIRYTQGTFPKEYVPTVFDNWEQLVTNGAQTVKFSLWDTAGREGYSRIRTLSYPKTDIMCICYSCDNMPSFRNIFERWFPEIHHFLPEVPLLIIRTRTDLPLNPEYPEMTFEETDRVLKEKIPRLVAHLPISSLTCDGFGALRKTFADAISSPHTKVMPKKKSVGCTML